MLITLGLSRSPEDVIGASLVGHASKETSSIVIPHGETKYTHRPRHSITSSAMACTPGGMVNPSAFAVRKLMTSSNLVGSSTDGLCSAAVSNFIQTY